MTRSAPNTPELYAKYAGLAWDRGDIRTWDDVLAAAVDRYWTRRAEAREAK